MINISDEEKALYKGVVYKTVVITVPNRNITFTNTDLIKESVTLTERIETERNLSFKGCCASVFSFSVDSFVQDIRGEYIEATIQADEGTVIPLFCGYIETQSNRTFEDFQTDFTAYDPLINVLDRDVTAWYNSLTFPILVRNMRNSFFSLVGITQESAALVNDNQTLNKTIEDKVITGGDILRWLCQINGRFGLIGRDKKFHYVQLAQAIEGLYPDDALFPADDLYPRESNASEEILKAVYSAISYQPFHTDWISKVSIIGKNGAIQGTAGDNTGDEFYISDNKLAWGLGNIAQATQAILNEVRGARYTPADIDAKGLPYLECGDIIIANTRRNVITTYILERTLKGIQALTDAYGSDSDQSRPPYVPTIQTDINANALAIDKNSQDIYTTNENLSTTNENLSTTNSNVDALGRRVTTIAGDLKVQGDVIAKKADVESVTALEGEIRTLKANYAELDKVVAGKINANSITSSFIAGKFSRSDAATFGYLKGDNCSLGSTRINTLRWDDEGGTRIVDMITVIDRNGTTHRVLGWK